MDNEPGYIELPRGGFLIQTQFGPLQIGVPPETIKDTMVMPSGVPTYYILPQDFFYIDKGISVAEVEFPLYFNYYIKKTKTHLIVEEHRIPDIIQALWESNFGPERIDLREELGDYYDQVQCIPDLKSELAYFQSTSDLEDLVEFITLKQGKAIIDGVQIEMHPSGDFTIIETNGKRIDVPGKVRYHLIYDVGTTGTKPFIPPRMGITCLGPSHGFDPTQNTSGFILWLNNQGIMIDPPVASTEWLQQSRVNFKYIDSIILTHCHADHDAGTFQKILAEEKINIYTTRTIMDSFVRKYSALTHLPPERLYEMFRFQPVLIEKPITIHHGIFTFFYALHAIPTISFKVEFRGKSFVYSSDHHNDPTTFNKLYETGVISAERRDQLINFPWDTDIIYHESGLPPLHTPISFLNGLPKDIQKRIVVYHIAEKDFPANTDLSLAKFGIENTHVVDVDPSFYDEACDILQVLEKVEFFNRFNLKKVSELLSVLVQEEYKQGDVIFQKGDEGTKFYIITSGQLRVEDLDIHTVKRINDYDTFGEGSLLTGEPRNATIIAETPVNLITIDKESFLHLIQDTDLENKLLALVKHRTEQTWDTLCDSEIFDNTTSFQKTAFEAMLKPYAVKKGYTLIQRGKPFDRVYLVRTGKVRRISKGEEIRILERGDLVGDITQIKFDKPATSTFITETSCDLYYVTRTEMVEYIETYPNVYMTLIYNEH